MRRVDFELPLVFGLLTASVGLGCSEDADVVNPESSSEVHSGSASWSPDSSKIAFYSDRDGNGEIYTVNVDGTGLQRLTRTQADESYPSFSPDGTKILFDSGFNKNFDLYVMSADGTGSPVRLTRHPARDVSGAWSPDGKKIAFMSDRDGGEYQIYVMDSDGSNQQRMSFFSDNFFPQWSPDGTELAFHVEVDIHVYSLDGLNHRRLTRNPNNGMYPSWSPDGKKIAFMSWRGGGGDRSRSDVFVMNADGSDPLQLTNTPGGASIEPRWSPDGTKILYLWLPRGGDSAGSMILYVMDSDGSNQRPLLPEDGE